MPNFKVLIYNILLFYPCSVSIHLCPIMYIHIMKTLNLTWLFLLTICFAEAQTIKSSTYSTRGYIKSDGTIQNSHYITVGYIKSDGTIQNAGYTQIGKITSNGAIQDAHYSTIGYIDAKGTVKNSHYSEIGRIDDNGTVYNAHLAGIGYAQGVKKEWAAVVFFFFDLID